MLFESIGVLRYFDNNANLFVDQGISNFYFSLIPKSRCLNGQRHPAHISVVRNDRSFNREFWKKHEGEKIPFYYSHDIHHGKVYYWLNAFSKRLEEIRTELGLSNMIYNLPTEKTHYPPDGFNKVFHITLGNVKEL